MSAHWDLVFPNGNEERLLEMAERLGFSELMLCYELKDPLLKDRAKEVAKLSTPKVKATFAILVTNQNDVAKAKQLTANIIATPFQGVFEDKRITHVIGLEGGRRDDFLHHRNSGLTQVGLRECARTGKTILVDAGALLQETQTHHPSVILGRMLQNNEFYRKEYDVPVRVISAASEPLKMRAPRDMMDLLKL